MSVQPTSEKRTVPQAAGSAADALAAKPARAAETATVKASDLWMRMKCSRYFLFPAIINNFLLQASMRVYAAGHRSFATFSPVSAKLSR
jgi:hypothetical protein